MNKVSYALKNNTVENIFQPKSSSTALAVFENHCGAYIESAMYSTLWNNCVVKPSIN